MFCMEKTEQNFEQTHVRYQKSEKLSKIYMDIILN